VNLDEPEHYRVKHPAGTPHDPAIAAALAESAPEGRITCVEAHAVARRLGVTPAKVGDTADMVECRIIHCQMGLFGYKPEKKIVKPAEEVPPDLRRRLDAAVAAGGGKVECAMLWRIAADFSLEKMAVAAACEALGIKIVRCQIGAF
jgi:hypothetical protein